MCVLVSMYFNAYIDIIDNLILIGNQLECRAAENLLSRVFNGERVGAQRNAWTHDRFTISTISTIISSFGVVGSRPIPGPHLKGKGIGNRGLLSGTLSIYKVSTD